MPAKMKPIDLSAFTRKYKGKWIALAWEMDKVFASGDNPYEVRRAAEALGHQDAIITKLPPPNACLVL